MELIKREITIVLISTAAGIGIIAIVSFFIVWIGFPAENPKDSFKDALFFSVTLFGGLATLGAAVVAAYLISGWKHQARFEFNKETITKFWDSYIDAKASLVPLSDKVKAAGYANINERNNIFEETSCKVTIFYFQQQRLELFFNISDEDIVFSELESITQDYVDILDPQRSFDEQEWFCYEKSLIDRLNNLQPKLYKRLKESNIL
ncbi:hypothetical protein ACTL4S_03690 [Acinetobacter lwoffii]|uniref:hypothetical protein n=1 Tax=Acinetobacter lwoffii TaxID=28090 RepID=UPI003F8D1862